ncbi:hypothetical protein [Phascolarctobacterium succinatutens]|uniref:hypothetical protein n=1 Tax=Phascolarctobacterium succinatutens TaxID=626940 RepID=UPI003AACA5FD
MDFETKEEKLRFELLEKAYYDAFVKKETNTRCPICYELVHVWEEGSCYGADCKCGFMNDLNRGL